MSAEEFDQWVDYALYTINYIRLFAFINFVIFIRNLILLKSKFPSFGVLFYTLSRSKGDIMRFLIVIQSLLFIFNPH